jgi:hypothetical protein
MRIKDEFVIASADPEDLSSFLISTINLCLFDRAVLKLESTPPKGNGSNAGWNGWKPNANGWNGGKNWNNANSSAANYAASSNASNPRNNAPTHQSPQSMPQPQPPLTSQAAADSAAGKWLWSDAGGWHGGPERLPVGSDKNWSKKHGKEKRSNPYDGPPAPAKKKNELCKDFLKNRCTRGDACIFKH